MLVGGGYVWTTDDVSRRKESQKRLITTEGRVRQTDSMRGYSPLFVAAAGLFIACLIAANIISVKVIAIGDWVVPAGVVVFPVSYILGDVLTEVYGYRSARRVIWLGFLANLVVVLAIWVAGMWPAAPFWH